MIRRKSKARFLSTYQLLVIEKRLVSQLVLLHLL
jgi:hypothetical protein